MNFSTIVIARLFELKMSQKELAEKCNISFSYLSKLINGKKRWNEEIKEIVCSVLSIKVKYETPSSI